MFYQAVTTDIEAAAPAVITLSRTTTWGELAATTRDLVDDWACLGRQRVGLLLPPDAGGIAALAALDRLDTAVFLFDEQLPYDRIQETAAQLKLAFILRQVANGGSERHWNWQPLSEGLPAPDDTSASVTILTSGTEGRPKAARHTWRSLSQPVRMTHEPQRWLLTYRLHLYAGLQVMLQALLNRGTLAIADSSAAPDEVVQLMQTANVRLASATPSYWRRLVLFADRDRFRSVPMQQITLGGEAIDQQILDSLHAVFPEARLIHIYATTELGRCFAVSDRLAGFPARFLEEPTADRVELKVVDGQLFVRPAHAMEAYDAATPAATGFDEAGWFATGDLVRREGDRVFFAGRRGDRINVGGNKVQPLEIENALRGLPQIADVRVFGQASSLAGQLVACQVVRASRQYRGRGADRDHDGLPKHALVSAAAPDRVRAVHLFDSSRQDVPRRRGPALTWRQPPQVVVDERSCLFQWDDFRYARAVCRQHPRLVPHRSVHASRSTLPFTAPHVRARTGVYRRGL